MATEQACRMLKTYRKKLNASKEVVDLDDLEDEVCGLLKTIRERKDRALLEQTQGAGASDRDRRGKVKAATESDVDHLTKLMERVNMVDSSPTSPLVSKGQEVLASEA